MLRVRIRPEILSESPAERDSDLMLGVFISVIVAVSILGVGVAIGYTLAVYADNRPPTSSTTSEE